MYAKRFSNRKAKSTRRPVKRVPRKRSGGRKAIVKIVKSVLSRQAENKAWFDYGINQTITCVSAATPVYKNLIPILTQGTGHSGRVGNEIRVKSGYIRGHVNLLPYNSQTNTAPVPVYIKMWVLSNKYINTNLLTQTVIASDFFDIVNSSVPLQGNMLDIDLTLNKDMWTLHASKSFKLGASYSLTPSPVSTGSYFDNSPMSLPFYFNIGKFMKTVKYDDTTTVASNKNLFICFQAVAADGSNAALTPAEFHYATRVEYEDL